MSHNHREPAEELLGKFFPAKARWAFPALLAFFALLFLLAWLIRYPDIFTIRVLLRAEGRLERFYAEVPGRIAALPFKNGERVDSGVVVLVWGAGPSWEDIIALGWMEIPESEAEIVRADALGLGDLEAQWATAKAAWEGYRSALQTARTPALSAPLSRQLARLDSIRNSLHLQAETRAKEVELAKSTWERNLRLVRENAMSAENAVIAEGIYLEKKAGAEALGLELHKTALEREALERELLELALLDDKDLRREKERWEEAWQLLMAQRGDWIRRNIIFAGQSGTVAYSLPLEAGQWVDEGTPLLAIQAEEGGKFWKATGRLPAAGAGKIPKGAEVQLRLDAFPYEEFGSLSGTIAHISPLSENDSFLVEMVFPDPLITGTGLRIVPEAEMPATARIFSSRKRLLDRLLESLRRL